MDPGSGDRREIVYSGLPGNTVGMATMVDTSEASKQKSELWAADADAQSRTAEDLTTTELTTPVPGRNPQQNLGNDINYEDNDSPKSVAEQLMARLQIVSGGTNMKGSIEGDATVILYRDPNDGSRPGVLLEN